MNIVVRPFEPVTDSGFIFSTLPKSIYYGSSVKIPVSRASFFSTSFAYVEAITTEKHTRSYIACLKDNPYVIIGYAIIHGTCLEFVYVKELFRGQKIATLLLKNQPICEINEFNLTKVGSEIMKKHMNLFKKEQLDEPDTRKANQDGNSSI